MTMCKGTGLSLCKSMIKRIACCLLSGTVDHLRYEEISGASSSPPTTGVKIDFPLTHVNRTEGADGSMWCRTRSR
jgi:hypothetical protein